MLHVAYSPDMNACHFLNEVANPLFSCIELTLDTTIKEKGTATFFILQNASLGLTGKPVPLVAMAMVLLWSSRLMMTKGTSLRCH